MMNLGEMAHPEGIRLWVHSSVWRKRIVRQRRDQAEQQHSVLSASWWIKFEQSTSHACGYSWELGLCLAFPTMVGSAKCLHWYSFKHNDLVEYTMKVTRKSSPPVASTTLSSLKFDVGSSRLWLYPFLLSFSRSSDQTEESYPGDVLLLLQTCRC